MPFGDFSKMNCDPNMTYAEYESGSYDDGSEEVLPERKENDVRVLARHIINDGGFAVHITVNGKSLVKRIVKPEENIKFDDAVAMFNQMAFYMAAAIEEVTGKTCTLITWN